MDRIVATRATGCTIKIFTESLHQFSYASNPHPDFEDSDDGSPLFGGEWCTSAPHSRSPVGMSSIAGGKMSLMLACFGTFIYLIYALVKAEDF
jgi:hypothetical protein